MPVQKIRDTQAQAYNVHAETAVINLPGHDGSKIPGTAPLSVYV